MSGDLQATVVAENRYLGDLAEQGVPPLPPQNAKLIAAAEIRAAFSGKQINPLFEPGQATLVFTERFFTDGSWINFRDERTRRVMSGSWTVKNGHLCTGQAGAIICRPVWRDDRTGFLYTTDPYGPGGGQASFRVTVAPIIQPPITQR